MTAKSELESKVSGLKRKIANTFEASKRAELVNELRNLGHEFDGDVAKAVKVAERDVKGLVPEGRSTPPQVTAEAPTGDKQTVATPEVSNEITQETPANSETPKRGPGRPRKDENLK